jgi:hypothetical protein
MYFTRNDLRYYVRLYKLLLYALIVVILVLSVLFIEMNWYRTRYTISKVTTGNSAAYYHEDERTTGIINYLTGRGPLPESERLPLYRQYVKNMLERSHMDVPEDFHTRDWDGVNALAITWCRQKVPQCPRENTALQKVINKLFENAIRPPLKEFTPNVNDNLWHLLESVGSPKVRWLEEQDEPASRFVVYSAGDEYCFYDPTDNTVYIRYSDSVNNLLDEAGHSKQFRDKPIQSYVRMGWSMFTAWVGGEFDMTTAQEVYKLHYKDPKSFEGEAHGPIKDKLLRESGLLIVDKEAPKKT